MEPTKFKSAQKPRQKDPNDFHDCTALEFEDVPLISSGSLATFQMLLVNRMRESLSSVS